MRRERVLSGFMIAGFISFILLIATAFVAEAADAVRYGETGPAVTELQQDLRAAGYVGVVVDGRFGPRTLRAVNHFQRANGLAPVNQAGPLTLAALDRPAPTAEAVRGTQTQINAAPVSGPCPEWADELAYFSPGWDVGRMQQIMNRESRCRPDVTSNTGCCHGLLQIHQMHIPNLAACGVDSASDLFDPGKNVCSAAILYRRAGGMSPWNL